MARMAKSDHKPVANEKVMGVLLDVQTKVDTLGSLVEIQSRRINRFERSVSVVGSKIGRFETQIEKRMGSFEERLNEIEGAIKTVVEWGAMKADLKDLATKGDLERVKNEIIEPISNAVDKDAETVYDHGKRITVLERKVGIIAK